MQYRVAGKLPDGIYNPAIDLRDSTMALSAELDFQRLAASSSAAEGLQRFMGDSARVITELYPTIAAPGEASITVLSLQAGLVPVPPMFIPMVLDQVLESFDLESGGGRVVSFPIPEDVRVIRIENEEGAWQQQPTINIDTGPDDANTTTGVMVGEGGYDGLIAVFDNHVAGGTWTLHGLRWKKPMPNKN